MTNLFLQRQVQGTLVTDNFFDACEARLYLVSEGISGAEMRKCAYPDLCPQSLQMNAKKQPLPKHCCKEDQTQNALILPS